MKKARKARRTAGMIAAMFVVVLSFFPILRTEGGNVNIIQIVTHENFEFHAVSGCLLAVYLFIPIVSLLNYWMYLRKSEGIGKMILSTYITIFGLLSVFGVGMYYTTIAAVEYKMPSVTIWVFLRFGIGFFEAINRMSGEELFERILKEQS